MQRGFRRCRRRLNLELCGLAHAVTCPAPSHLAAMSPVRVHVRDVGYLDKLSPHCSVARLRAQAAHSRCASEDLV